MDNRQQRLHSALLQEIAACEDRRYEAMINCDLPALEKLLSDDLLYTHSSAATDTKAQYLASLETGATKYKRASRDNVTVRLHENVALINGHVLIEATINGVHRVLNNAFLNVWVKNANGWQMTAWASTPLPKA